MNKIEHSQAATDNNNSEHTRGHERVQRDHGESSPTQPTRLETAFADVKDEIEALPDERVESINVDLPLAVNTCLGAVDRLMTLRPQIADELPRFPIRCLDRLETYALATGDAHSAFLQADTSGEPVAPLHEACARARDSLLVAAHALVDHGLLPAEQLTQIPTGTGFRDTGYAVLALEKVFQGRWGAIANRTAVTAEELDEAGEGAERLIEALAKREQSQVMAGKAAEVRRRAWTLMANAYDQVRRAVVYLRWERGDADEWAPSLYEKRGSGSGGRANGEQAGAGAGAGGSAEAVKAQAAEGKPVAVPAGIPACLVGSAERPVPQDDPFGRP